MTRTRFYHHRLSVDELNPEQADALARSHDPKGKLLDRYFLFREPSSDSVNESGRGVRCFAGYSFYNAHTGVVSVVTVRTLADVANEASVEQAARILAKNALAVVEAGV